MSQAALWTVSLDAVLEDARRILAEAQEAYDPVKTLALFSGGNDSTVMLHIAREQIDAAVHINTGIGIPETRSFVRATAASFGLPLIEESPPPGHTYEDLVMEHGFPGPGGHLFAYSRLKERALRKVRQRFIQNGRRQRVLFVTGIRRAESQRRMPINDYIKREGSVVWVSPLLDWSNTHMDRYREDHPEVPRNEVSDHLHMSGECLCGAFARPGELDEIAFFYPETAAYIRSLEAKAKAAGKKYCSWGHRQGRESRSPGPLCSDCVLPGISWEGEE